MRKRAEHKLVLAWVAVALLLITGNAQAVSLGKIEVASFLDEPFYGEISLNLDSDESVAKVLVEIASASDYKIFEIYRDRVLKLIRADIVNDSRGVRVELASRASLQSPFFNLVLKIRYGRITHFKKFPVFLEPPKSIQMIAQKKPLPSVKATSGATQMPVVSKVTAPKILNGADPVSRLYDGWARTGRYGPIVRGDSLSIVAERLRVDYRYTRNQIMAALFEKNRGKFDQNNMNLLKAGSFLDVPKAAEVERLSKSQALGVLADHEKRWKELTKEPRYAAEKVAQKMRYSKRVQIGQQADGSARTAPVTEAPTASSSVPEQAKTDILVAKKTAGMQEPEESGSSALKITALRKKNIDLRKLLEDNEKLLNQKNTDLRKRLEGNEKLLSQKIESATELAKSASSAALAKLEVLVAQMQGKLEEARKEIQSKQDGSPLWVVWLLSGLVAVLLGVVGLLLRREPVHPASAQGSQKTEASAIKPETGSESAAENGEQVDVPETPVTDADAHSKTDSFDAVVSDPFAESTDADTSGIESFDTSQMDIPDPDVDYLAEVDVYVRYGMEEEALQQVDMALRLQPDNVEAHIKKAEVLRSSNHLKELAEAVAVAGGVLAGDALERFKSAVGDVSVDAETLDYSTSEITEDLGEQAENDADTLEANESDELKMESGNETDGIDFDILDVPQSVSDDMSQQAEAVEKDKRETDLLVEDEPLSVDNFSLSETAGEQSYVSDQQEEGQQEVQTEGAIDVVEDEGATQALDSYLSSFVENEEQIDLDETVDDFNRSVFEEPVHQQSDGQVDINTDHVELMKDTSENRTDDSLELDKGEALQKLDNLLGEFSDDDDILMDETVDGLDESVFAKAEQEADLSINMGENIDINQESVPGGQTDEGDQLVMGRTIDLSDLSEGTLELDGLFSEFSNDEGVDLENTVDGLDESIIEKAGKTPDDQSGETIALDAAHASTEELDNLLSDFADDDDKKA